MAHKMKSITAAASAEAPSTRPPRRRMVQNFLLIWLDGSIDEVNNDDCRNSITKLRQVVNDVNTFTDMDECVDFITNITQEKVFIIVSGTFSQIIAPLVHDISQVSCVYIFCDNKA